MVRLDKNTTTVALAIVAAAGAWADQKTAVGRLEQKLDAVAHDVAVLQREVGRSAMLSEPDAE